MPPQIGFSFTFSLPAAQGFTVALSRLREDIGDWRPFWRDVFLPAFYRSQTEQFVTEGSSTGSRWAPLSPAYAAWKTKHTAGRGILERSGALKASLISPTNEGSIARVSETTLEVGTTVPHAVFHQFGTRRMPQRPPMRVTPRFMEVIGAGMNRYVEKIRVARLAAAKVM